MSNDKQNIGNTTNLQTRNKAQASIRGSAKWGEVQTTLEEIQGTFGFVPSFIEKFSDQAVPGAWSEVKNLYFNPNTALDPKLKHLIGLAVGAQIPCEMIGYFEENFSFASGISYQEQCEAVLMAGLTRHWSTVLNGSLLDKAFFQNEADHIMTYVEQMMKDFRNQPPTESMFLVKHFLAAETYQDIEKTLGLVPKFFQLFPEDGLPGAWSEFKGLQLNPFTALSGKEKELIGLSVAAQIPCEYCIYFHRSAARLNGATDREMQEAIAMAALTRHWSAVFHSGQMNMESFKQDADRIIEAASKNRLQ
jgi:AhpD family alkylhydroperoxidase